VIAAPSLAGNTGDEVIPPYQLLAHSDDPILPPPPAAPATLARFFVLYEAYVTLETPPKGGFAHWIIAHGVRDARTFSVMMQLYVWAEQNRETAAR
jgi:hypothetical protein